MPTYVRDAADPNGQTFIDHGGGRLEPVTTPDSIIERAARADHKAYCKDRMRMGVHPADLPEWEELGPDGRFYFTDRVRSILRAIREPSEAMLVAGTLRNPVDAPVILQAWQAMIDAALAE